MIPDKDILGNPKPKIVEPIKFEKKLGVGKSIYQNHNFNTPNVSNNSDYVTIGLCICFALMALLKAEGFNLLIILSAISFIVFRLITNTGITLLHEVIIDYETKKITCTFKKNKKELEKVEFNFDEIVVSTFRSKNQGIFLQIEENEKSISFLEGKSGLETNEFHKLKSELNQIEHQNSAWWRNMKEVFPNIP